MPRRQPALIFDFGNVVAFFDYARACKIFGEKLGLSGEAFLVLLRSRGLTPIVERYERGVISASEFSKAFCQLAGFKIVHTEFAAAWTDIFWLNRPVSDLIKSLRGRGYTLVLGSNTNDMHAGHFRVEFADTLAHFDELVLSYEIGHVKPSEPFYRACAEAARAEPHECVFIDDMPENVAGARAAGLMGVRFWDVPALVADLQTLGVDV
jgi:putative hydrolase of the HAD superfamily